MIQPTEEPNDAQPPRSNSDRQRFQRLLVPDSEEARYSIARLQAFHKYRSSTNALWLTAVLLGTPLPILLVMTGIFSIPNQDPANGWQANPTSFLQIFVIANCCMVGILCQRGFYVPPSSRMTLKQNLMVLLLYSVAHTLVLIFLCSAISFPVPFGPILPILVLFPVFLVAVTIMSKRNAKTEAQNQQKVESIAPSATTSSATTTSAVLPVVDSEHLLLAKYRKVVIVNTSLVFIYSIYMVGFRKLHGIAQLGYILLLPVLREVLVRVLRQKLSHLGDLVAASTVFSVKLANSMFASLCMGGANSSREATALIILLDVAQIGWSMVLLFRKSRSMTKDLQRLQATSSLGDRVGIDRAIEWSLKFTTANRRQLEAMPSIQFEASNGLIFERNTKWMSAQVAPVDATSVSKEPQHKETNDLMFTRVAPRDATSVSKDAHHKPTNDLLDSEDVSFLRDILAFMFMIEYTVLVEYVEAAIPVMMVLFYSVIYYGPNCQYNLDLSVMPSDHFLKSMASIVFYGSLEWASLVLLFVLIKWRFRLNVFLFLGFVLETQLVDIWGKLIFFLPQIVAVRFVHQGADFTFQFKWLHQPWNQTTLEN